MTAAAARRRTTDWSLVSQRLGAHLSLIFFGIIFMLPFLWMVSSSLKPSAEIFEIPVRLIPKTFVFTNYPEAIESIRFLRYLGNTFIYAVGLMTGAVLSNVFIGYGFARIDWPGRDIVFIIVIATMMLPAQVRFITIAIFDFMWGWHDYINPLVFLRDPDKFTLSVGLRLFFSQYGAEWALLMAAAPMFTLPMIVVFFFAQRTFIEGISFTGVKG